MYWLRWHYHVKDIAGALYKIKQNKNKQKGQHRRQSVVAGRQQLYCQYSHDHRIIVKRQPEKYCLQLVTERRQRRYIPHWQWEAVPCTCRTRWEGTVAEHWTSGGHQHGSVSHLCRVFNEYISNMTWWTFSTCILCVYSTCGTVMWWWAWPVSDS